MAPNISGMAAIDQPRAMHLIELGGGLCRKQAADKAVPYANESLSRERGFESFIEAAQSRLPERAKPEARCFQGTIKGDFTLLARGKKSIVSFNLKPLVLKRSPKIHRQLRIGIISIFVPE